MGFSLFGDKKVYNTYAVAAIATIGGSLFGFDVSSMSAIIGTRQYLGYFNSPDPTLAGGITASMAGFSLIGSLIAGFACDKFGRKKTIQYSCAFWIIGSVLCCAAQNVAMLIVGRCFNGLCVGVTSSQVPVYLSEISRREVRGKITGLQQWSIEWGILIMYFIGYGCSFIDGVASFRVPWGIQAIPALLLFILVPLLPESPRWLATKGEWEECLDILANIHAKGDREDPEVLTEMMEIRELVELDNSQNNTYMALFSRKQIWRTHIGVASQISQQLAGGNVMMYYVVYVFEMAGLTGSVNLISSAVQYIVFLVFTFPVLFIVDKVGRRPMLIVGSICMGTCIWIVGIILAAKGEYVAELNGNPNIHVTLAGEDSSSKAVLVFSYLFTMFYALTLAPVCWIYSAEIFPLHLRSKGMALAASGNWAMNFALAFYVPPAFNNIGWKAFAIFGVFNYASAIHMFFAYPETAKKTLEEIDDLFIEGAPRAWRTHVGSGKFEELVEEMKHDTKPGADHVETVSIESV